MFVDHAVVRLFAIEVLHQVVPHMPLPNDLSTCRAIGLNFDHMTWPQTIVLKQFWIASLRDSFVFALAFPCDHQQVAVWHRRDIVVKTMVLVGIAKAPN